MSAADRSGATSPTPVAIVGAGPVGLSLALGLARQGVRSVLVERKPATSEYSKAPGIHVRTREAFRQWGVEERFLEAGTLLRTVALHSAASGGSTLLSLDFSDLDVEADRPGLLILEQSQTERLLLDAARESGLCDVRFGAEAVGLAHDEEGARLTVREAGAKWSLDAEFVVGCDGASSFVRPALGLPFAGITYSIRPMLADVRLKDQRDALPWPRLHNGRDGLTAALRLSPGLWRLIRLEAGEAEKSEEVPADEVSARVAEALGAGPAEIVWASRFRIHLRASPRFRIGRVLLAGDAAHVHSPIGGQGMNAGIQDAHNLAWKLASAVRGGDAERLLDSYEVERRAVVIGNVSRYTDLLTRLFLQQPAFVRAAAFLLWRVGLAIPPVRRIGLRRTAMIDLGYPASPLLDPRERSAGVRLPNPTLHQGNGTTLRLYDLLPNGPVVLAVTEGREGVGDELPVPNVIRIGPSGYLDPSGLLRGLLGGRDGWILVRPDGHVAWARDHLDGIADATRRALGRISTTP